jgi:hypothetical protein
MAKMTKAMRTALQHGVAGRSLGYGLHGQSQWGGFDQTWKALYRRGWIDAESNVTEAGAEAIGHHAPDTIRNPHGGLDVNR